MSDPLDELAAAAAAGRAPRPGRRQRTESDSVSTRVAAAPSHRMHLPRKALWGIGATSAIIASFTLGRLTANSALPIVGGSTPYSGFANDVDQSLHDMLDRIHQKYGATADINRLPAEVQIAAEGEAQNELQRKVARVPPPPMDVDPSAATWVAKPQVLEPDVSFSAFSGTRLDFRADVTAARTIPVSFRGPLWVKYCDKEGATMGESPATSSSRLEIGERGMLRFSVSGRDVPRLASFRIFYRTAPAN